MIHGDHPPSVDRCFMLHSLTHLRSTVGITSLAQAHQEAVTVNQHERYQDPENEAASWYLTIIHLMLYSLPLQSRVYMPADKKAFWTIFLQTTNIEIKLFFFYKNSQNSTS